jgi:hypothetical protein
LIFWTLKLSFDVDNSPSLATFSDNWAFLQFSGHTAAHGVLNFSRLPIFIRSVRKSFNSFRGTGDSKLFII